MKRMYVIGITPFLWSALSFAATPADFVAQSNFDRLTHCQILSAQLPGLCKQAQIEAQKAEEESIRSGYRFKDIKRIVGGGSLAFVGGASTILALAGGYTVLAPPKSVPTDEEDLLLGYALLAACGFAATVAGTKELRNGLRQYDRAQKYLKSLAVLAYLQSLQA